MDTSETYIKMSDCEVERHTMNMVVNQAMATCAEGFKIQAEALRELSGSIGIAILHLKEARKAISYVK